MKLSLQILVCVPFFVLLSCGKQNKTRSAANKTAIDSSEAKLYKVNELEGGATQLSGKEVEIEGAIYRDPGGYFWLVDEPGVRSNGSYAIQITGWPFIESPPKGGWTRRIRLVGLFESGDDKNYDFLVGPTTINLPRLK